MKWLLIPSKWKKWLCWFRWGRTSFPGPVAMLSAGALCPSPLSLSPSLMFSDMRHVGQEVSCSSHERRHELHVQHTQAYTWEKNHKNIKHSSVQNSKNKCFSLVKSLKKNYNILYNCYLWYFENYFMQQAVLQVSMTDYCLSFSAVNGSPMEKVAAGQLPCWGHGVPADCTVIIIGNKLICGGDCKSSQWQITEK